MEGGRWSMCDCCAQAGTEEAAQPVQAGDFLLCQGTCSFYAAENFAMAELRSETAMSGHVGDMQGGDGRLDSTWDLVSLRVLMVNEQVVATTGI